MSVIPIAQPTDADLLAEIRGQLSEVQPPVEDIRNALAMFALTSSGRTDAGGLIFGFTHIDLEAVEALLRRAVIKLDAARGR